MNTSGTPVAYGQCLRNKVKTGHFCITDNEDKKKKGSECKIELKVRTGNCERLIGINFHTIKSSLGQNAVTLFPFLHRQLNSPFTTHEIYLYVSLVKCNPYN